jgi:hypothetical protein
VTLTATVPATFRGGANIGSDVYLVGGRSLLKGRLDTSTTTMHLVRISTALPAIDYDVHAAGGPGKSGQDELLVLTTSGVLYQVDLITGDVTILHTFPPTLNYQVGLIRVGPSEYFAAEDSEPAIIHVLDGAVTEELATTPSGGFAGLADVPGLGLVACTSRGGLFLRQPGGATATWQAISGNTGLSLGQCILYPYGAGQVLFGGDQGFAGTYSAMTGVCMAQPLTGFTIGLAFPLGDEMVLTGDISAEGTPVLDFVAIR